METTDRDRDRDRDRELSSEMQQLNIKSSQENRQRYRTVENSGGAVSTNLCSFGL